MLGKVLPNVLIGAMLVAMGCLTVDESSQNVHMNSVNNRVKN